MTQPTGSRNEGRAVPLAGWRRDLPERQSPERSTASRILTAIGVLAGAALLALFVAGLLRADEGNDESDQPTAASSGTTAGEPEDHVQAAPALRIHPQRAAAGPPLELTIDGMGCPGRSGTLSITEVGTATDPGGAERLVVRRQFDVAADNTFHAAPLLVGQPPGSYRVAIECARRAIAAPTERISATADRDTFNVTELLELTGPAAAKEFTVSPQTAAPGLRTQFAFSGSGCSGRGASVEVKVFQPSAMARGPLTVVRPIVSDGTWQGTHTVGAAAANGTYTFEATCSDSSGPRFAYVSRHVQFETEQGDESTGVLGALLGALGGPPAPKAAPALSRVVTATPTYTG